LACSADFGVFSFGDESDVIWRMYLRDAAYAPPRLGINHAVVSARWYKKIRQANSEGAITDLFLN